MSKSHTSPHRDTYWDTVKALLIFLVTLGHSVQFFIYHGWNMKGFWDDPVFKSIYLFHMPLFMLISGYFAAKSLAKRGKLALLRYFPRLALPCVGMGLLYLLLAGTDKSLFRSACSGFKILWFLIVLFECVILYYIMQLKQQIWYKSAIFALSILVAILFGSAPPIPRLWPHATMFTYLWPIFVLGAGLAKKGVTHEHINWKLGTFCTGLYLIGFAFFQSDWYVYVRPLAFQIDSLLIELFRSGVALAGCCMALWACKYIHRWVGKYRIIQNIGKATLALYVLQTPFFDKSKTLSNYLPEQMGYLDAACLSLGLVLALYGIYLASRRIPIISQLLYGESITRNAD